MKKILYLIPFLIFIHSVAYSQAILIKPKQILDVRSGKLINADILVESGVIKKVAKNIPIKSEDLELDNISPEKRLKNIVKIARGFLKISFV